MKSSGEILVFIAAILFASIACYGFAFSSMPALCGVAISALFPIYSPKQQNPKPVSQLAKFTAMGVVAALIGLLVWSAISGYTYEHNVWFQHWRYRPAVAFVSWLVILSGLVLVFRSRIGRARSHES